MIPGREFAPRRVPLPRGGELLIRPVTAGDVDGLTALYARLDTGSRYRRFFSVYQPDREFFERMVAVGERRGAGLVAAASGEAAAPGGGERLVAEAAYELLPNGDGELAITVDGAWRGWLGPYLLDALVEVAASRGVPNLEADILMTNGPMLALARSRGYAVMPKEDWTELRVVIGAAAPTPTWPGGDDRPRVLVEGAGGHWRGQEAAAAGLEVLGCPGPDGCRARCPVLAGRPCPLAAGADAIVVAHPPDTDRWRTVRAAHGRLHPGVPVCVELAGDDGRAEPGETALPKSTEADVVAVVERLARESRRERSTDGET